MDLFQVTINPHVYGVTRNSRCLIYFVRVHNERSVSTNQGNLTLAELWALGRGYGQLKPTIPWNPSYSITTPRKRRNVFIYIHDPSKQNLFTGTEPPSRCRKFRSLILFTPQFVQLPFVSVIIFESLSRFGKGRFGSFVIHRRKIHLVVVPLQCENLCLGLFSIFTDWFQALWTRWW